MSSALVNAWKAGKNLAFYTPKALHIGTLSIISEAMEIDVSFGMSSYLAMTNTMTSVSGQENHLFIRWVLLWCQDSLVDQQRIGIFVIVVLEK